MNPQEHVKHLQAEIRRLEDTQRRSIELLKDASFMLEDIRKARELPGFAHVQQQYVALGREIREFLTDEGVIQ